MKNYSKTQNYALLAIAILFNLHLNAQVTIGSGIEPDMDAILDLKQSENGESSKGLLLPRVALISTDNSFPLLQHTSGMIVYNTNTNENISSGLFYNDGTKWNRIGLTDGLAGQTLSLSDDLQPRWVTMNIPDIRNDNFFLVSSSINISDGGVDLATNNGISVCVLNYAFDNKWRKIGNTFSIVPKYKKNRLLITLQTTIQKSGTANGWVSYAGGIFVNNLLKSANIGQLSYSNTGSNTFETILLHMVVENLEANNQNINVAITRIGSSANQTDISIGKPSADVTNLNNFMARPSIYFQYYEDPTSLAF
ncbi:MAG: hypothetical protein LBV71_01190 [Prevotella sp.]|jgi:hypothetical protein|nr:hypothetical protein [Prevotella sp.]